MKAIVLRSGALRLETDFPQPTPERDEALIRVLYAGVCDTDVALANGYMTFEGVPGHEFVGVVEGGSPAWVGKRVVGEINCACGVCEECQSGRFNHCRFRTVLGIAGRNGVFAEYFLLPTANLHTIPDTIDDQRAVFVEPLAAALNIVDQVHIAPTAAVAIVGDGKLGLLAAQVLALAGARVTVIGHHPARASKLAAMGQALPIIAPGDAPAAHFDVVVEATGAADGLTHALQYVRPRGQIILKTTIADPYNVDLAPAVINEITLIGNRCGPFAPALRLLACGALDPLPLVERVHTLADVPSLLTSGAPGLKHLIKFD